MTTSDLTPTLPPLASPPWHAAVQALPPALHDEFDTLATHFESTLNLVWSSAERLALASILVAMAPDQAEVYVAMTDPPADPSEPHQ